MTTLAVILAVIIGVRLWAIIAFTSVANAAGQRYLTDAARDAAVPVTGHDHEARMAARR